MTQTIAPGGPVQKRRSRWLLFGYLIAIACLIWVYYDFNWSEQWRQLLATDWRWIVLTVALNLLAYVVQGIRWNLLLCQVGQTSLLKVIQAIYIGLMANEILPLRTGEIIRCYLVRRWTDIRLSVIISSVAIERLLDGLWLMLGFYVVSTRVALPGVLVQGGRIMLVVLLAVAGLLTAALFYHRRAHEMVARSRWKSMLRHVVDGVYEMGRSWAFVWATLLSLVHLALHVAPAWALMRAYGMNFGVWEATVVLVVLRVATVPPGAPGNVGSFQFATVLGLRILGVDRQTAASYATLFFFLQTIPHIAAGFLALVSTRLRLKELHQDAHESWESQREIKRQAAESLIRPPRD